MAKQRRKQMMSKDAEKPEVEITETTAAATEEAAALESTGSTETQENPAGTTEEVDDNTTSFPEGSEVGEKAAGVEEAQAGTQVSTENAMVTQSAKEEEKVEAPPVPEPDPAPEPAPAPNPAPAPAAPAVAFNPSPEKSVKLTEEEAYLNKIEAEGTVEQKRILAAIRTFNDGLRPKMPITEERGAGIQHEFFQHLVWALEKDYDVFRQCWNVLLVFFKQHHGKPTPSDYSALSEYSTNRFLNSWRQGYEKASAYRNLITLLRATRNPETRRHDAKTIKIEILGPDVLSAKAIENIRRFYEL